MFDNSVYDVSSLVAYRYFLPHEHEEETQAQGKTNFVFTHRVYEN
jgi:hypothetical protein